MDYEQKYNASLEQAKKELATCGSMDCEAARLIFRLFPQLAESEDDRIRKELIEFIKWSVDRHFMREDFHQAKRPSEWLAYLEKHKEQPKEELVYRLNGLMQDYIKKGKDEEEREHRFKCYQLFWDALEDTSYFEQKEQKPTPDWMPKFLDKLRSKKNYFDWDEHREIEGHILAIINWIAPNYFDRKEKEQKPVEWSEEDEERYISCLQRLKSGNPAQPETINSKWYKKHVFPRPHWKPSKEQMEALLNAEGYLRDGDQFDSAKSIAELYEQLKAL